MKRFGSIVAVLLLGVAAADLVSAVVTFRLSRGRSFFSFSAADEVPPIAARAATMSDRNVFGAALEDPTTSETATTVGPTPGGPPGQFMVLGVMDAGALSSAIIRDVAGDSIGVVRLGGRIFFSSEYLAAVDRHGAVVGGVYGRRRLALGVPPDQQPALVEAVARPPGGIVLSRAEINASLRSADELLGSSQITPELRDGKIVGFRITVVAENTIVKKMGIVPGDIIRSVNGHHLDSFERSAQIWEQVKKATEVHMTVERDGKMKTMSFYLRP